MFVGALWSEAGTGDSVLLKHVSCMRIKHAYTASLRGSNNQYSSVAFAFSVRFITEYPAANVKLNRLASLDRLYVCDGFLFQKIRPNK